jgi:hypothetical protein
MLGIAALEQSEWPPYGKQRFFFEDLVRACADIDLQFFFFSPFDALTSKSVKGWIFDQEIWKSCTAPLPYFIYDRAFSALPQERKKLAEFRQWLKKNGLKVLNPVDMALLLDDKVAFHNYLQQQKIPTLEVLSFDSLKNEAIFNFADTYFIKPLSGSGGLGIYVVEKRDSVWILKDHLNEFRKNFDSLEALYRYLNSLIKAEHYFIQPKAKIKNFEGSPFDLRVLIQNYGEADYRITGMAVRQGQQGSNVSNLQSGGTALAFEELNDWIISELNVSTDLLLKQIKNISFDCCAKLHKNFGAFLEIGLDFLLTTDGPLIMEGNARPSRWVFNVLADRFADNPEKALHYKNLRKLSVRMPGVYALELKK